MLPTTDIARRNIIGVEQIGTLTVATGTQFQGTEIGGLSSVVYDATNNVYYAVSDAQTGSRFYRFTVDLTDGALDAGDVTFTGVTSLTDSNGTAYAPGTIDPEGIALAEDGRLFVTSEGFSNSLVAPFLAIYGADGRQTGSIDVPSQYDPVKDNGVLVSGVRHNLAFESLTITPDQRFLYTATEGALVQDGPAANLDDGTFARVLKFDLATGDLVAEYFYETEEVAEAPVPENGFFVQGLVELTALDNAGTFLSLERSFSAGVGNTVKLFQVSTAPATEAQDIPGLAYDDDGEAKLYDVDAVVSKKELFDFGDLGITIDNLEGVALGPTLADGRQSVIIVSDNNFDASAVTQVIALAIEVETIPTVAAVEETPDHIRFENPLNPNLDKGGDSDDPAIYINQTDPTKSFVITAIKNEGIQTFDLAGNQIQAIAPAEIRYNNVDLIYDFSLGGTDVDLAVFSDRENDTIAIYRIDPATRQLTDVTAASLKVPAFSIFGVDDGDATAYGLTAYSSASGDYVFTTQASGNQVAQLRLTDQGNGLVGAELVRTLDLPVITDDAGDAQAEGMVVDQELGVLYVGKEKEVGVLRFNAEPDWGDQGNLVLTFGDEDDLDAPFVPDLEGLALYYGPAGDGYLVASSQGSNTFAVFDRTGGHDLLGSFAVGEGNGIDAVQETDGIDLVSTGLGGGFENGLLVVQDGSAEPQASFLDPEDEDEYQNFNTNFKFVDWQDVSTAFDQIYGDPLAVTPSAFDPRSPVNRMAAASSGDDVLTGTETADNLNAKTGDDLVAGVGGNDLLQGGSGGDDKLVGGAGIDTAVFTGQAADYRITTLDAADLEFFNAMMAVDQVQYTTDALRPVFKVEGPDGTDRVQVEVLSFADRIYRVDDRGLLALSAFDDSFQGGIRADKVQGSDGDDTIATLGGADWVFGGDGDDTIDGGKGADIVSGGNGNDRLDGGAGNDFLFDSGDGALISGGDGADTLIGSDASGASIMMEGGSGADLFGLVAATDAELDVLATIGDFDRNQGDKIDLSHLRTNTGGVLTLSDLTITGEENAVIDLSGLKTAGGARVAGSVTLLGIDAEALVAGDFIFTDGFSLPDAIIQNEL